MTIKRDRPLVPFETFLRSLNVDNFVVDGDRVTIDDQTWIARPCDCGLAECDLWAMSRVNE